MDDVVVCSPSRTAVGRFGGVPRDVPAADLATTVVGPQLLSRRSPPEQNGRRRCDARDLRRHLT